MIKKSLNLKTMINLKKIFKGKIFKKQKTKINKRKLLDMENN